jgi:hypothetical protein
MTQFTHARQALIARILEGYGRASHAQRRAAFDKAGLAEPLRTLIDKVVKRAYTVTDEDIRRGENIRAQRGPDLRARRVCRDRPGHAAVRRGLGGPRGCDGKEPACASQSSITAIVSG